MRTVTYRLADLKNLTINLGFVGENEHTVFRFDCMKAFEEYPDAVPSLAVTPPNGDPYPAVTIRDGDYVEWTINDSDVAQKGNGEAQLTFIQDNVVMKDYIFRTKIERSILPTGEAPDPIQTWIDEANEALGTISGAVDDAEEARDAAIEAKNDAVEAQGKSETAQGKAEAAQASAEASAQSASGYADSASESATNAQESAESAAESAASIHDDADRAVQAKEDAEDARDDARTYAGNAEQSAGQASASATTATTKAGEASQSAGSASSSASTATTQAGVATTKATEAGQSATSAQTNALKAEGYAVGKQNGTDVSSSSPYYHKNAKYYADSAAQSAEDAQNVLDSIPQDYTQLSNNVSNLKSAFDNIVEYKRVTPDSAPDNYRLKNDGNAGANQQYKLLKYAVTAGQKLYVHTILGGNETNDRALQFQDREIVSTSGNASHVVGTPIDTSFDGYITVPTGAKYLIISVLKTDTESGVYSNAVEELRSDIAMNTSNIDYINDFASIIAGNTRIEPTSVSSGWELNTNGVSNSNANVRMLKYAVTEGDKIAIIAKKVAPAVYQFQNSATVPGASETPRTRVGDTITEATAAFVTVPEGATYVIINDELNGTNGLYKFTQAINPIINSEVGRVNLIAHKGGDQAHDGTFARLTYSADHGYKILEVDAAFTSDGVAVVQHDSTITVGGTTYTIASETYATLSALDLGDGEHLITLEDAVLFCKKRGLVIEIDLSNVSMNATKAATIMGIVIGKGMLGSAIITGTAAKQAYITAITREAILSVSSLYDTVDEEAVDDIAEMIPSALRVICSINHSNVTEAIVDYAHGKGLIVKTWTHTSASTVNADLAIGVDLAICDNGIYPDTFIITN